MRVETPKARSFWLCACYATVGAFQLRQRLVFGGGVGVFRVRRVG